MRSAQDGLREFKTDEFGNNYPVITEGEKTILKYSYIKNPLENTQDSNYTELIYAELDQTIKEISLTNEKTIGIRSLNVAKASI